MSTRLTEKRLVGGASIGGASIFDSAARPSQNSADREMAQHLFISSSSPGRPLPATLTASEGLLQPSPPGYNALKKTDPPKEISSDSSVKTTSGCTAIQTASSCDVLLAVSTPKGASTALTRTVTSTCSTITSCSATDKTSTKTLPTGGEASTLTPVYDNFLWDNNTEWYYLQQLILRELSAATWPVITWTAESTKSRSPIHPAPTSRVDLGILTCGSPFTSPTEKDAVLRERTDQGNPEFWMTLGERGQSGLIDGITTFCHFLTVTKWVIDPSSPLRSWGIQFPYNDHIYDPIYFGLEWHKADDCPVLDFKNDKDEAVEICEARLNTIVHRCDTSSNGYHWWKQGGSFFRDCLEWQVYRDTWRDDRLYSIPTSDSYRPPKKCREIEDCKCARDVEFETCADFAEYSDLGWCSCGRD